MSIYIARGDDTLGPYTPAQAADLVRHGDLRLDDYAARDGDAEWMPLADFLPKPAADVRIAPPPPKPRRRRVRAIVAVLLLGGLAAVGLTRLRRPPTPVPPTAPVPRPALRSEMPAPLVIVPGAGNTPEKNPAPPVPTAPPTLVIVPGTTPPPEEKIPAPPAPAPEAPPEQKAGRLTGTVQPAAPAAVRVSAYPLATLEPYLAQKRADMQKEIDRLAPMIADADAEKAARIDDERRTLQEVLHAAPDDEMASSLVFAHDQAKAAVATAEKNCRYLLDQRRGVLDAAACFQDLPPPVATAETDPQGGFVLELPPGGPFAVAASAPGDTPDGPRCWFVKVPTAGAGPLLLSDANAMSAGADALLIR